MFLTVTVNNDTNINKGNNNDSLQLIEHIIHYIQDIENIARSWMGTCAQMFRCFLDPILSLLDDWISNGCTHNCFHSNKPRTITNMNESINMDS